MQNVRLSLVSLGVLAGIVSAGSAIAADYEVTVTNITGGAHFTPVIAAAHDPAARMFELATVASPELQAVAEGGDVSSMAALLESIGASVAAGDGLVAPGQSVTLSLSDAAPGSVFSMSAMILPTNDGFAGIDSAALPSDAGSSVTLFARGYDSGTEANDELVGSGAPGMPGFPNPPPVVATGTGVGGTGVVAKSEGFVHIHPGVIGDLDDAGGVSDINAAVHRWMTPVARVVITRTDGGGDGGGDPGTPVSSGPSAVQSLAGAVYSQSALEIFWEAASSTDSAVVAYRVLRDGSPVAASLDGLSFFEEGLDAGTQYTYSVSAIDADGNEGPATTVDLTTN